VIWPMSVFCVHLVYISSCSSWICQKLTVEQLLGRAGSTERHGFGPPITVQIILPPPLSSSLAGQGDVLGQFSIDFGLYV
jgi:hypothetical protein